MARVALSKLLNTMNPEPPPIADPHLTAPLPRKKTLSAPIITELNPLAESCLFAFLGLMLAWFTYSSWAANRNRPNSGWVELTTCCGLLSLALFLLAFARFRRWQRERKRG